MQPVTLCTHPPPRPPPPIESHNGPLIVLNDILSANKKKDPARGNNSVKYKTQNFFTTYLPYYTNEVLYSP